MRRIRTLAAMMMLALVMSLSTAPQALAGDIPSPPGVTGEILTPGAAGETQFPGGPMDTPQANGDIGFPGIAGDILTPGLYALFAALLG